MAGFLGNTTSFSLFEAPVPQRMDFADAVRALPFSDAVTPEGKRMGWVGLGNAVDTDFSFGIDHGRFVALSLRVDRGIFYLKMAYSDDGPAPESEGAGGLGGSLVQRAIDKYHGTLDVDLAGQICTVAVMLYLEP